MQIAAGEEMHSSIVTLHRDTVRGSLGHATLSAHLRYHFCTTSHKRKEKQLLANSTGTGHSKKIYIFHAIDLQQSDSFFHMKLETRGFSS